MICCNIEIGALKQEVYHYDNITGKFDKIGHTNIDFLSDYMVLQCYNLKDYSIHLYGNKSYCDGIVENIYNSEIKNYNQKKVYVEVN